MSGKRMEDLAVTAVNGDVNPLKSDPELQMMLKKLDKVKKYNSFQRWKSSFLDRLEQFLYEEGMVPAEKSCTDFGKRLITFTKSSTKVQGLIEKGDLCEAKKTVKASLALNEMCNSLTTVVAEVENLVPFNSRQEKKRGFTKFHVGAVLIRQGFHQYATMQDIQHELATIGGELENVADRQQHELFEAYVTQVQRFCDVMADLGLYEVVLKCLEFAVAPEESESEDPETMQISVETWDGKVIRLELEATETIGNIKEAIAEACEITPDRQVMTFRGKKVSDDTKTLEALGMQDGSKLFVEPFKVPVVVNNTMDGTQIKLMVNPTNYITDIKRMLVDESGIPAKNQALFMNNDELNDNGRTCEDYGISDGTVLDLEPKTMQITVETPDGSKVTVEVKPSDTADSIKALIAQETDIDVDQQVLKLNGKELPNGKTIKSLGVKDGSELKVDIRKVPITVNNTMDGTQVELMVNPMHYLSDIKRLLEKETGLSAKNQNLFMNGNELGDNSKTIADYGIEPGAVLDLEPKSIEIIVETPDGKKHTVEVQPCDTTDAIKAKIANVTGMLAPRQVLKFKGKELPNGKTAQSMGIREGSALQVDVYTVPVTVNTLDGKKIEVMVDPTSSLKDVKRQLEDESGLAASNQKLFMDGDELVDDSKSAEEYGIEGGSVLDLEPRSIKLTVETPDGKKRTVEVSARDTADSIKEKVAKESGIAASRQVLKFNGKQLPKGKTVVAMGLRDGSELKVEIYTVPVTVNTMDGKKIEVMVDPSSSLKDIKRQLEDESGLAASNQKLFMNGDELADDNKTAADYGIKGGSVLDLQPKSIKLAVETPDGKKHDVEVSASDTTDAIKAKIADKTGMAVPRQVLFFKGKQLPNGKTVVAMGLRDGSELKVKIYTVPVTVNTIDGKKIEVMVDPTSSLKDIKRQLEDESGLLPSNQKLSMNGDELKDDNKTAADYGIKGGSVLDLEPKKIQITVETPDGKKHKVEVSASDTSDTIKAKIADKTGMAAPRQVLKLNGKELPNGKTAVEMGVRDGSELKVEVFKVPVTVNTLDGKRIKVSVDPTSCLSDIKRQLESESGLPASNQKLFMNGDELKDDGKTASDYGIKSGSVLDLEPKSIRISVSTPDGKKHAVEVSPSDTSDVMKAKIAEATGVAAPRQVLKFNDKQLPDGKTASAMGIEEGSTIAVDFFKISITVKPKDGSAIKLAVEPCDTIGKIKNILEKETGLAPKKQCLKLGEDELNNDRSTVSACGIKDKSSLTLETNADPIIFVDCKCGTLFAMDRDLVVAKEALTPHQNNKLDFTEAAKDSAVREKILKAMKASPRLGVATQVVVEKGEVMDYDLAEAEKLKSKWGVTLKKREKNKAGEELIFIDVKTGAAGELSRKKYIDMKLITPVTNGKVETLGEEEKESMVYEKYIQDIRQIFGVKVVT